MNQRRIWSDPLVVTERRPPSEDVLGREMEMPDRRYSAVEQRIAAAHFAWVEAGCPTDEEENAA